MSSSAPAHPAPEGILVVDKPVGPTSFDIVARIRRASRQRRIGHGGTLDPLASGVLPLFLGRATRLAQFSADAGKEYRATIRFGAETTTYDAEGEITRTAPVDTLTREAIERALERFVGEIEQLPPMYSAVQVGGQRLYALARQGREVERPTRRVTIFSARLVEFQPPEATVEIACSKGTYIRSLAHDLGRAVEVGAHLTALRRTRSGPFTLEQAVPVEVAEEAFRSGNAAQLLLPADAAVQELRAVTLDGADVVRFQNGQQVGHGAPAGAQSRIYSPDGEFLGLARAQDGRWQPDIVFGARTS